MSRRTSLLRARRRPLLATSLAASLFAQACVGTVSSGPGGPNPGKTPVSSASAQQEALAARAPDKPLPTTEQQKKADAAIERWFNNYPTRRAYLQLDKPLYQPGESVWFRAHMRQTKHLQAMPGVALTMKLVSPKGAIVGQKRVMLQDGVGASDFELPAEVQGGEYVLELAADDGTREKRSFIVASYEAPRLKKTLEFIRKSYGPGDQVSAALSVARGTGEPFARQKLTAVVTVDDQEVARVPLTTDDKGNAVVKFALPAHIEREDGLLTVLADDGGITESIQKRIPIILGKVDFAMFPEGGDLIDGLLGRVYFLARNTIGKPADVEGRVVDSRGNQVASFKSLHDGLGRFELTPKAGERYVVELGKQKLDVPAAKSSGCSLTAVDDFDSKKDEVRVAVACTSERDVLVESVLRERRLASASYHVAVGKPTIVALAAPESEQGAVRVTVFTEDLAPLAERLIYRGRRADLKIEISADKKVYSPRDPVTLTVKTRDLAGKPVSASLALSVVDDTVLSFADDKTAHILSRLYLEPELGEEPVFEPNYYFGDAPEAAAAMDLLMGTRGWRRFEWQPVWNPPAPQTRYYDGGGMNDAEMAAPVAAQAAPMPAAPPPAAEAPRPMKNKAAGPRAMAKPREAAADKIAEPVMKEEEARKDMPARGRGVAMEKKRAIARDEDWDDARQGVAIEQDWNFVPVRVFPAPTYKAGYDGPRTDFRETIFWAHDVRTDKDGTAKVTFYLSDAVTSFRASAEGVSAGGLPGRGDVVIGSKLPVNLDVRLPVEVSEGDQLQLPVVLTNETDRAITAHVQAAFGPSFKLGANPFDKPVTLKAGEKRAFFFPMSVVGKGGEGDVQISLSTEGLKDELNKKIRVVPLGFPFEVGFSGTAKGTQKHEIDLTGAMPGSITGKLTMYPSPVASMTAGMAAMIREPGGCFEQTSSTNYPNIMVMNYLQENDAADPALVADASAKLGRGYKLLTGYESPEKGYEWFGENPGHEALTAYGLMEFKDMQAVFDDVDRPMVARTADWLMKRRDGKGGYLKNDKALDSFGRAGYETTALYITWALSEAGRTKGLDKELALSRKLGLESKDAYLVGLAANTMLNVDPSGGETKKIVSRLVEMQDKAGHFPGSAQSITMSGGLSLDVEATSLAALAMVKASPAGEYEAPLRKSVDWLNGNRGGYGEWGNTQGTVLGLKALAAYSKHSRATSASGTAIVKVNGREVGRVPFEKGRREAIEMGDLAGALVAGKNVVEVQLDSEASMPYSVAISYRSARPQSSERAVVGVTTSLAKKSVKLGEGIKMSAHIVNKTDKGQPMTLARLGLPGGLSFQTWQLKELRDKKIIGFYETRQREVVLYFRDLAPGQKIDLDLDLIASVPGTYVAPASSAYLYYTDEDKSWAPPVEVKVEK